MTVTDGIDFSTWWPSITGVGLWLTLILGLAEGLNRWGNVDPEIPRKIVHIGTGNVILLAWWLQTPSLLGILASVLFCLVTLASYRYTVLSSLNGVGRQSWGTFFYALSIGVLIAVFWPRSMPHLAAIGVLCMTWGDGLAALIGQRYGTHRYYFWGMQKSWEGSLTMMGVSLMSTLIVLWLAYPGKIAVIGIAGVVALVATLLETVSKYGLDNLTVPLGSAFVSLGLLSLLGM